MRTFFSSAALTAMLACLSGAGHAEVRVLNVWASTTEDQQNSASVYMTILSTTAITLVGAHTPAAKTTEILEVEEARTQGNEVVTRAIQDGIQIQPRQALDLRPSGYHVQLSNDSEPYKAGVKIPLTLQFKDSAGTEFSVLIQPEMLSRFSFQGPQIDRNITYAPR